VWLLKALASGNIRVSEKDPPGEHQFPAETLGFRSGSAAALALTGNDFIVAIGLGVREEAAKSGVTLPEEARILRAFQTELGKAAPARP
jgi:hypothetical protein